MSPTKETIMVLKVDLECARCYKKVKKLLCSFPQIKDQIYNEKQNTVTIKVVCCSPEKIQDILCRKGRKSIRSIEIIEPKKPDPRLPPLAEKPPPPVENPPKPPVKQSQEPAPAPRQDPPSPAHPVNFCCPDCHNGRNTGPCYSGYGVPSRPPAPAPRQDPPRPAPGPIPRYPVNVCCSDCYNGRNTGPCYSGHGGYGVPRYPVNVCCSDCYNGRNTGPCYSGYGGNRVPPPPPPAASGWCSSSCCDYPEGGYGNNYRPGYCVSRCGDYISEENPTACLIM